MEQQKKKERKKNYLQLFGTILNKKSRFIYRARIYKYKKKEEKVNIFSSKLKIKN